MPGSVRRAITAVATLAVATLVGVACATADRPGEVQLSTAAGSPAEARGQAQPQIRSVVTVSIDGLNPAAIRELGEEGTPTLHRLLDEGAATLNARTERELTVTLPNHTGMVTGRRVAADKGGHGVTWNDDRLRPRTVQEAAGHRVSSVFSVVHSDTRRTAVFASKTKFSLFDRSWDHAVDRSVIRGETRRLVRLVRADLADRKRAFRFVHLSDPDVVGHAHGFMGREYLDAVIKADRLLGRILAVIEDDPDLAGHTALVVTADHGGKGGGHSDPTRRANYRVPFLVWGPGVTAGANLYDLNPDYADPGAARTTYAGKQPVRNGDVANLVTDLLGLPAVRGSEHDADQDLDW